MSGIERLHAAALNRSARRQDGVAVSFSLIPRTLKISGGQGSSERSSQLCTRPLHLDVGRLSKEWNSLQIKNQYGSG